MVQKSILNRQTGTAIIDVIVAVAVMCWFWFLLTKLLLFTFDIT